MREPDEVLLRKALTGAVAGLAGQRRLTVVDLAAEGVVLWDLHRDVAGVPRGRSRPVLRWDELHETGSPRQALLRAVQVEPGAKVVLVSSFPEGPHNAEALEWLRAAYPETAPLSCDADLAELLRAAVADDPLTQWYDLVVLRPTPRGRLELACLQLFPPGARRGETVDVTLRCESSDEHGTAFAVVASSQEREFHPVSVHSLKLPPGRYEVTAELRRPGLVAFHGLPGRPRPDARAWPELLAAVPARLAAPPAAAHLICAVEVSGPADRVAERLSRTGQVIRFLSGELHDRLRVSLLGYGPHSFERPVPETPIVVPVWADEAERALAAVDGLPGGDAAEPGYPRAAQIECMLAEVARRLGPSEPGVRTGLLTVGDRPAFPSRVHSSEILPCPARRDWAAELSRLRAHPGLAFGAICDRPAGAAEPIWRELGGGEPAELGAVDVQWLGETLGLVPSSAQRIPFPLSDTE